jgi:hypothetical protein
MSNIHTGTHENYQFLTSDEHTIGDLVRLCPEAILGRYLAVTSTDSGEPRWWAEKLGADQEAPAGVIHFGWLARAHVCQPESGLVRPGSRAIGHGFVVRSRV